MGQQPVTIYDLAVVGDEVESVITAVSAARCGAKVVLLRASEGKLGGLSTRGGLAYMDITPEYLPPLFAEFLKKSDVVRVALDRKKAHNSLQELLADDGVTVVCGVVPQVVYGHQHQAWQLAVAGYQPVLAKVLVDATPDADVARSLGVPYRVGLGGVFGQANNFLGVSPVFTLRGVDRHQLMAFEASIRSREGWIGILQKALPYRSEEERWALIHRPCYSPDDLDYVDILNPSIGVAFHLWLYGPHAAATYPESPVAIDGFNIARLQDKHHHEVLACNGLVMNGLGLEALLDYSHGGQDWPIELVEMLGKFRQFLATEGGMAGAELVPPDELYVRQTLNVLTRHPMTAEFAIRGGVSPEEAIGTYSYWLDLRGITLGKYFPGEHLPKPVFNVGLDVAFLDDSHLESVAVVGRSAGYSPVGQGAGRIVQHNSMVGEAVGVAAALAVQSGRALSAVSAAEVRAVLAPRYRQHLGKALPINGSPVWDEATIAASALLAADNRADAQLRQASVV